MNKISVNPCGTTTNPGVQVGSAPAPARARQVTPTPVRIDPKDIHIQNPAEQALRVSWMRPGAWQLVKVLGPYGRYDAMLAKDARGARLLTAPRITGYTVTSVILECQRGASRLVEARSAREDGGAVRPDVSVPLPTLRILPDGVRKTCGQFAAPGDEVDTSKAVALLRAERTKQREVLESARKEAESEARSRAQARRGGLPTPQSGAKDAVSPKPSAEAGARASALARETGRTTMAVGDKVFQVKDGRIVEVPRETRK